MKPPYPDALDEIWDALENTLLCKKSPQKNCSRGVAGGPYMYYESRLPGRCVEIIEIVARRASAVVERAEGSAARAGDGSGVR